MVFIYKKRKILLNKDVKRTNYQVDSISVIYSKEISAVTSHIKTHTYSFLLNGWNARQPNRLQTGNSPVFIPFKK